MDKLDEWFFSDFSGVFLWVRCGEGKGRISREG